MTREEAIKILKAGSTFAYDEKEAGEFCEAYDMAVKALEAQDVDAISRQAVMWMLTNLSYNQCKTQGEADVIDTAKTMIMTMPSAQPDVVHCRECVHADKHFHCTYMNTWNPDGYCHCGKRKGKR